MPTIDIKNWDNKKVGSVDLPEEIFAYPYKEHLIHEAVRNYLAGWGELGWDTSAVGMHFRELLGETKAETLLTQARRELSNP